MTSNTPSTSSSPPRTQVKKENEEEIKEFAETAMNELLGWYGYERLELRRWAASRAKDTSSSPENGNEGKEKDECTWCNKVLPSEGGAIEQAGAVFCNEVCFSQSRRANFKRAKTCDWCRHVRHTVAYVDFQDGATQLQFCSDKCLNQYKMHIFCRETQAHLDLNPHLVKPSTSSNLITPDLWLKNCKSRSASPISDRSPSPKTEALKVRVPEKPETPNTRMETRTQRKSPLPLITIAPTAKLMKPKRVSEEVTLQKPVEVKKDLKNNKINLRKRRSSKCSSTVTSQSLRQSTTPKAQDLSMCSPSETMSPVSTLGSSTLHSPPHFTPHQANIPQPFHNPSFGMQPHPMFMENMHPMNDMSDQRHPIFSSPQHFVPSRPGFSLPSAQSSRPILPNSMTFPQFPQMGPIPPVTILVPHPVPIPIPLPIPIPIPMSVFLHAHFMNKVKAEARTDDNEGPLDFTMPKMNRNEAETETLEESTKSKDQSESPSELVISEEQEKLEQTLPKFKIRRVGNKMSKIVPKHNEQSEASRPLRKRRRLVEVNTEDDALITKNRKIVEV